jgi:hypothetical protein
MRAAITQEEQATIKKPKSPPKNIVKSPPKGNIPNKT